MNSCTCTPPIKRLHCSLITELFPFPYTGTKGSHLFKEETFHTLQWCDKCGKALWGLYRQGVQCSECGFQCHRKCMFDSIVVCPRRRVRKRRESDAEGKHNSHQHAPEMAGFKYFYGGQSAFQLSGLN